MLTRRGLFGAAVGLAVAPVVPADADAVSEEIDTVSVNGIGTVTMCGRYAAVKLSPERSAYITPDTQAYCDVKLCDGDRVEVTWEEWRDALGGEKVHEAISVKKLPSNRLRRTAALRDET